MQHVRLHVKLDIGELVDCVANLRASVVREFDVFDELAMVKVLFGILESAWGRVMGVVSRKLTKLCDILPYSAHDEVVTQALSNSFAYLLGVSKERSTRPRADTHIFALLRRSVYRVEAHLDMQCRFEQSSCVILDRLRKRHIRENEDVMFPLRASRVKLR